jgi:hypothetical protein
VTAVARLAWIRPLILSALAGLGVACVEIPDPVDATFAPPQASERDNYRMHASRLQRAHARASGTQADAGATP